MKKIPLTNGYYALVDDEDYERLNKYSWNASKAPTQHENTYFACRGYNIRNKRRVKTVYMHRSVLKISATNTNHVIHLNNNTLDNRKSNLKLVSHRQSLQKRRQLKSSRYPGVSWNKRLQKWHSYITVNYKRIHLGYFNEEKNAFEAYKEAVHKYTGEKLVCEI